jgi:hypothetical protein
MTNALDITGGDHGNYTLLTAGKAGQSAVRGHVRRNQTGGGYTVTLDEKEWSLRNMPKTDRWEDLGDAVAATAPK